MPVKTIAMPSLSAAAITSWSLTEPPGWMTAVAPASAPPQGRRETGRKRPRPQRYPRAEEPPSWRRTRGINAAHLAGADAQRLAVARIDDGVGLDVLADPPGKEQAAQFFGRRRTPGHHFEFGLGHAGRVGVLQQQSAGDMLDDRPRRRGLDLDQAQILLGSKALAGFGA